MQSWKTLYTFSEYIKRTENFFFFTMHTLHFTQIKHKRMNKADLTPKLDPIIFKQPNFSYPHKLFYFLFLIVKSWTTL